MKTTTLEEFRAQLRSTGGYETPPERLAPRRRASGAWTTFYYTTQVLRVFPLCAIYEPLGKLTTDKWAHFCFSAITGAEKLGIPARFEGWENRANTPGPVVYLCNHLSTTETIMLPPVLLTYGPFNIVAKESLSRLPLLRNAAAHMGMVPITRRSPREDLVNLLKVGEERIRAGNSFLIFPQGTRQAVFSRSRFSSIGAKLAERAQCPVVPVVVDTRCQTTRKRGLLAKVFKDFGPVDTRYDLRCACGPAIPAGKARDMHAAAFDWMAGKLESWGMPVER